jgi:hypothetical protein
MDFSGIGYQDGKSMMVGFRRAALGAATAGLVIATGIATPATVASAGPSALAQSEKPTCVVNASPHRFIESGLSPPSSVAFVIRVGCAPMFSEQAVEIRAPQLSNACQGGLVWYSATTTAVSGNGDTFDVRLDDDGNATAFVLGGPSCAASWNLIDADLTVAPYPAVATLVQIAPPVSTQPGVWAYPASEVEDAATSSVATVFYVEFPSVYAERQVQITDAELYDSCASHLTWIFANTTTLKYGQSVTTTLDDNGNAFVVAQAGPSCATGSTLVQANLVGPPYTTLTTEFTVLSPRVTVEGKGREKAVSKVRFCSLSLRGAPSRTMGSSPRSSSRRSSECLAPAAKRPRS